MSLTILSLIDPPASTFESLQFILHITVRRGKKRQGQRHAWDHCIWKTNINKQKNSFNCKNVVITFISALHWSSYCLIWWEPFNKFNLLVFKKQFLSPGFGLRRGRLKFVFDWPNENWLLLYPKENILHSFLSLFVKKILWFRRPQGQKKSSTNLFIHIIHLFMLLLKKTLFMTLVEESKEYCFQEKLRETTVIWVLQQKTKVKLNSKYNKNKLRFIAKE